MIPVPRGTRIMSHLSQRAPKSVSWTWNNHEICCSPCDLHPLEEAYISWGAIACMNGRGTCRDHPSSPGPVHVITSFSPRYELHQPRNQRTKEPKNQGIKELPWENVEEKCTAKSRNVAEQFPGQSEKAMHISWLLNEAWWCGWPAQPPHILAARPRSALRRILQNLVSSQSHPHYAYSLPHLHHSHSNRPSRARRIAFCRILSQPVADHRDSFIPQATH